MPAPTTRRSILTLLSFTPPPQNTVAPVISGTNVVGQTLTRTTGTWTGSPASFTSQWFRDSTLISGETGTTYVAQSIDIDSVITCHVTATGDTGTSQPATSNGLTIHADLVGTDLQMWTAGGGGIGGSPQAMVPAPNSVFDNSTHAEDLIGDVEYRAVYIKNTHAVRAASTVAWIQTQTTSLTTDIAIGVAPEAAGSDVTAIANEQNPPVGVSFAAPSSEAAGLSLGTIGPGQARGLWLRRTVLAGTADLPVDACEIDWAGTAA